MRKKITLQTSAFHIKSEKIPEELDGFRLALLSDLHNCQIGCENEILMEAMREAHPDCIMLAGDMITDYKRRKRNAASDQASRLIRRLARLAPVYFSMGNHEERWRQREDSRDSFTQWRDMIAGWGVAVLDNESVPLPAGNGKVVVTGLSLPLKYYSKLDRKVPGEDIIRGLIGEPDPGKYQILLAHTPAFFESYLKWGADLTLAGHYHGGVIRLPFFGGVISTSWRLFPKYDYGLFHSGDGWMAVSGGLGWHTIPVRIGNPPEMMVLTLHHEEKTDGRTGV